MLHLTILLAVTTTICARDFQNPVSNDTDSPERKLILLNGTYYDISTTSDNNPEKFPILTSMDLKTWTKSGFVFNETNLPRWSDKNQVFFAREMHKIGTKYLVYYTTKDTGVTKRMALGLAVAEHPLGPYRTADRPFYLEPSGDVFDSTVIEYDDKELYLAWYGKDYLHSRALTRDGLGFSSSHVYQLYRNGQIWHDVELDGPTDKEITRISCDPITKKRTKSKRSEIENPGSQIENQEKQRNAETEKVENSTENTTPKPEEDEKNIANLTAFKQEEADKIKEDLFKIENLTESTTSKLIPTTDLPQVENSTSKDIPMMEAFSKVENSTETRDVENNTRSKEVETITEIETMSEVENSTISKEVETVTKIETLSEVKPDEAASEGGPEDNIKLQFWLRVKTFPEPVWSNAWTANLIAACDSLGGSLNMTIHPRTFG